MSNDDYLLKEIFDRAINSNFDSEPKLRPKEKRSPQRTYEETEERNRLFLEMMFPKPAAHIPAEPAIDLDRDTYNRMKAIVSELKEIHAALHGRPPETTLFSGEALVHILELASHTHLP